MYVANGVCHAVFLRTAKPADPRGSAEIPEVILLPPPLLRALRGAFFIRWRRYGLTRVTEFARV